MRRTEIKTLKGPTGHIGRFCAYCASQPGGSFLFIICIGLLAVCGCATGTPTAEESLLVDLGPAPEQKFSDFDSPYWQAKIEQVTQRLLSCQTREEFDQEVREINAELEKEYQQRQMIDAIESLRFDLWRSTYWQEKNAEDEYWKRRFGFE